MRNVRSIFTSLTRVSPTLPPTDATPLFHLPQRPLSLSPLAAFTLASLPAMTTPKNLAGMTPGGSFGFSPALLGQSPAALLKHKSPLPSGGFGSSPGAISALGIGLGVGNSMGLNMGSTPAGQGPPDENRKAELAEILKLLHSRPGRVSELEIERLAKGMG